MGMRCILVVEDEALIAADLEMSLADAGYQVLGPAASQREALEIAQRKHPDLAFVDINLLDGKTGIDLARKLRDCLGVPSIFLSGQSQEAHQNQDAALGYIGKPYDHRTVLKSVEVAGAILDGEAPSAVPRGLELFQHPH